jgi:hypothetical protein
MNSALPSSLILLLFFLPFTWGRHCCGPVTTALPGTTSLELLILFAVSLRLARPYTIYLCVRALLFKLINLSSLSALFASWHIIWQVYDAHPDEAVSATTANCLAARTEEKYFKRGRKASNKDLHGLSVAKKPRDQNGITKLGGNPKTTARASISTLWSVGV